MKFVLVYRGPLSATQGRRGKRKKERIEIKKKIVPQMKRLWETHGALIKLSHDAWVGDPSIERLDTLVLPHNPFEGVDKPFNGSAPEGLIDLSGAIEHLGKQFRPLVRESLSLTCSIDMLFLRQGEPGSLRKQDGDLDNRIKTFIDALEMPPDELEGDEVDDINYTVLENDTLIKELNVRTERLLLPETEYINEVHIVATIRVHVERVGSWNLCLL